VGSRIGTAPERGRFTVLTLTETAAEAVRQLAAGSGLEPDPGLRIAPGAPTPEGTPLELQLTSGPEASDQTVEEGGANVYLEGQVADALEDKVLDVAVEEGQVRFTLLDAPHTQDGKY
jgi:iron-sulfur cluster assembly protein